MTTGNNPGDDPVMIAAEKALESGDASCILAFVPEESEKTVRNLLERACCQHRIRKDPRDPVVLWYFRTIRHLHSTRKERGCPDPCGKTPGEKSRDFSERQGMH